MDIDEFKYAIIDKVKDSFEVKKIDINFQETFYYSKLIHLIKFNIEQYEIKDLGNMAILRGSGFEIMKLLTVVFTPNLEKDIPLVIIDFIKMGNKITVFVEFYLSHMTRIENIRKFESRLEYLNSKYTAIENYIETPNWYTPLRHKYSPLKKGKVKDNSIFCEMVLEYLGEYLKYTNEEMYIINKKNIKLEAFINDLIYKGNPSIHVLQKALGKEETERLFREIVFFSKESII